MTGAYWWNGVALMLTVGQERSSLIETDVGSGIRAVTFTANGECIIGGVWGCRTWSVPSTRRQINGNNGSVGCPLSRCVEGWQMDRSGDRLGRLVCVGRKDIRISLHAQRGSHHLYGVDLSPDSARLVRRGPPRWGHYNSQTSTNTRPRGLGDSSEILAARRSYRDIIRHFLEPCCNIPYKLVGDCIFSRFVSSKADLLFETGSLLGV